MMTLLPLGLGRMHMIETINVGNYLHDHQVQPLTEHYYVNQTIALNVTFFCTLPGMVTPAPLQPIPMLNPFTVKKIFPMFNLNLTWHSLKLFSLLLSLVAWEKRLTPPIKYDLLDQNPSKHAPVLTA